MFGRIPRIALVAVILFFAIYPFFIEVNLVEEVHIKVETNKNLAVDSFVIAQVSDLHIQGIGSREEASISIIEKNKPDIIVVTGDLISDKNNLRYALEYIERLARIAPVYVVFGNWDHWSGISMTNFKILLEGIDNVTVLMNEYVDLGNGIIIAGVDDPHTHFHDLPKALPENCGDKFIVLLAHSPEIIGEAAGKVDLILSGHTHGGQVVLPLIGPLYVPLPSKYRKYASGMFHLNGTVMYVNRGLGTTLIPVRFLCRPEVTIIEIVRT
ncbi:MAG TPA: metallophosphoesterase [Thermoprotei archaeon]|nr:metallophosphoesterase [Thermoprotei archaeon]